MADDEEPTPDNNIAAVRALADVFAEKTQHHGLTPLQAGYVSVAMGLTEAANRIRTVAGCGLSEQQLIAYADQLQGLADDTLLLGQAITNEQGSDSG